MDKYSLTHCATPLLPTTAVKKLFKETTIKNLFEPKLFEYTTFKSRFKTTTVKNLFKFAKEQNIPNRKAFVIETIKAPVSFIGDKYNEDLGNSDYKTREKIEAFHDSAADMANILANETDIRLELDSLVQHHLGKMISDGTLLPADLENYRDRHLKQLLLYLEMIVGGTEGVKTKPGRSREEAAYRYYKRLYYLCEHHGITPKKYSKIGKENSILHKIRDIVGPDSGISLGEYDGVINMALKKCENEKEHKYLQSL